MTSAPDWADWCFLPLGFLPLAGTYAIVSKGTRLQSPNQAHCEPTTHRRA
jgi:hypothetical protein